MNRRWQNCLWIFAGVLAIGFPTGGCVSESNAKLREKNAFLAGQNLEDQKIRGMKACDRDMVQVFISLRNMAADQSAQLIHCHS